MVPKDPWPSVLKLSFPPFPPHQDMFDKTKSGRIDVYGFSALWKFIQQWKNLFQQYDRDRSGSISYTELQQGEGGARARAQAELDFSLYSLRQNKGLSLVSDYQTSSCITKCCPQHRPTPHPFHDRARALSQDLEQGNTWDPAQGWTPC